MTTEDTSLTGSPANNALARLRKNLVSLFRKDIVEQLREHQPAVWVPEGETVKSIREWLATMSIDGSATGELAGYAVGDCERFLHTVGLVPDIEGTALEIGANPYFTTVLLNKYRRGLTVAKTNYFDGSTPDITQQIRLLNEDGSTYEDTFESKGVNVENDTFPWPDQSFDVVLYCEVIEHLQMNPMHSLSEIWRVLKPGGLLVLTTPNVCRLENVARMIAGANLYDPYSGYGPYGRHNREYTKHELWTLLNYLGYEVDTMFTADVSPNHADSFFKTRKFASLLQFRANDLGQYIFSSWKKTPTPPQTQKPIWLYRSYPFHELAEITL